MLFVRPRRDNGSWRFVVGCIAAQFCNVCWLPEGTDEQFPFSATSSKDTNPQDTGNIRTGTSVFYEIRVYSRLTFGFLS